MSAIRPVYVSCDAGKLYGKRDFPGPEDERRTVERAASAGEFICELFPPYSYVRPIDPDQLVASPDWTDTIVQLRKRINAGLTGARSALFRLPRTIVRDRVLYLDDGASFPVVYETHRPLDRFNSSLGSEDELKAATAFDGPDGPILFLGSTGCFNYGHFLIDDLTRLSAFWAVRARHPGRSITILLTGHGGDIDRVRSEAIGLLLSRDADFTIDFVPRPVALRLPHVYCPTPTTLLATLKSPEAMHHLREWTLASLVENGWQGSMEPHSLRGRRLFIDRGPSYSRKLTNGPDLFAELSRLGFEKHTLDQTSFVEQASLLAEASIVIGNVGAAMTNTLFCPPGTPLLYLGPEGWDDQFYWDLAAVMDHRHYALYGTSEGDPFKSGFSIDVARVMGTLDKLPVPF